MAHRARPSLPLLHCPPHTAAHGAEHCSRQLSQPWRETCTHTNYSPSDMEGALAEACITVDAHACLAEPQVVTELTRLVPPPGSWHLVQRHTKQLLWLHILNAGRVQCTHHVDPPAATPPDLHTPVTVTTPYLPWIVCLNSPPLVGHSSQHWRERRQN